jgi:hypothetical protein
LFIISSHVLAPVLSNSDQAVTVLATLTDLNSLTALQYCWSDGLEHGRAMLFTNVTTQLYHKFSRWLYML